MHQLVNPGSHRLGFHGEYIEDIAPVRSNSELPEWVPKHEVWAPTTAPKWSTKVGQDRGRQIHHLMCELHEHTHLALADILNQIDGEIVVVSGDAEELKLRMKPYSSNQWVTNLIHPLQKSVILVRWQGFYPSLNFHVEKRHGL